MILLLGFTILVWIVINIFAINENLDYYKDWFDCLKDCNILELILIFTFWLPTTIVMGLIYVLSIKPFNRKEK